MNFALILLILALVTGGIYLLDLLFFARRRNFSQPGFIIDNARSFFPIFVLVLLLRSFLGEPFRIPSGSLEPTLLVGDFVAVNKFAYGLRLPIWEKKILGIGAPQVGEVAVFRWPPQPSYDYIKRVIGTQEDTIEYKNKVLYINGKEMKQRFIKYTTDESSGRAVALYKEDLNGVEHDIYLRPDVPAYDFSLKVPTGKYFMMGDNRDDSADSRYWGFVDDSYLRGKAFLVWMSWDGNKGGVRWSRIGHVIT